MNPTKLRLRGFRTYDSLDLDLPTGCVGIVGGNGAGKSSLVTAIELALFGPESRSLAPYVGDTDDLMVELEFQHAGERYRVRRGYSAKGRGKTTLDFEESTIEYVPGQGTVGEYEWTPRTGATAADTQTDLEQLLGLTRETWRASAYLAQGDGAAFSEAQPRDRKRILADVLGLHVWDQLRDLAGRDRRAAEQASGALTARVGLLQEQAADLEERDRTVKALALEAFACDEDLADATSEVERLEEQSAAIARAQAAHAAATAALELADTRAQAQRRIGVEAQAARERADGVRQEIVRLEGLAHEHGNLAITVQGLEQQERDRSDAMREQQQLGAQALQLAREIDEGEARCETLIGRLETLAAEPEMPCDRCARPLDDQARIVASQSFATELAQADAALIDVKSRHRDVANAQASVVVPDHVKGFAEARVRLAEIQDAPARLAAASAQLTALEETIQLDGPGYRSELERLEHEHEAAATVLAETDPVQPGLAADVAASLTAAKVEGARVAAARGTLRDRQAHAQAALDQARNAQEQISVHAAEQETLAREVDLTAQLERAFGRDGVPAHIVETSAIPAIEQEASRILSELGGPVTAVELRTERELKTGGVADALDVICHTEAGERDYATLSGGERTRVNLALRIALARLLSHRRGADTRLLAIDEPDGLDDAGMTALAAILRGLHGDFDRVLLVSHQPQLRDAFDTVLSVTRENGRSLVEVC